MLIVNNIIFTEGTSPVFLSSLTTLHHVPPLPLPLPPLCQPGSIEWFIEGQSLLKSSQSALHSPPLSPVISTSDTQEDWVRETTGWRTGEGGRGWARSRIIRPEKSLVLYKSFNTLWCQPSCQWVRFPPNIVHLIIFFALQYMLQQRGMEVACLLGPLDHKLVRFFKDRDQWEWRGFGKWV